MKICKFGLNRVYFRNSDGIITGCPWTEDAYMGNIFEQSFDEIYHGERANEYRERLIAQDYSKCVKSHCPYCMKGTEADALVDINEIPEYPDHLYLSFENICNYNCPSCTVNCMMEANKNTDIEKKYQYIEDQIRPLLPHLKFISANGLGELFVSKHIMKLLSEWKPLAPKEECTVLLETNGSLFNEENFKKIENVGQYNLKVSVTVMSFDEHVYQVLSGTKLPISKIEANLRYIKSLREQGIINYLELATVVQERNFRTLPELVRRFIDEFGADEVRLRPYTPWGRFNKETEWFADVRNPYHPYHEEYLEVMKAPIFKHPKVNDWGGGNESELGEHPYKEGVYDAQIMSQMIKDKEAVKDIIKTFSDRAVVYGMGIMGKTLIDFMQGESCIKYAIDKWQDGEYSGCPVINLNECDKQDKDVDVIVSIMHDDRIIKEQLERSGYDPKRIIRIDELIKGE